MGMVGERGQNEDTMEALGKKVTKLEKLCKVLRGETSGLREKLGVEVNPEVAEAEAALAEDVVEVVEEEVKVVEAGKGSKKGKKKK